LTNEFCILRQHAEKKWPAKMTTMMVMTSLHPQPQFQSLSLSHSLTDLVSFNTTDVRHFLTQINLQGYANLLIDNGFDSLWALKALDGDILDNMRITKAGHKMLLFSAVAQI
jgi:hypothetical protein